MKELNKAFQTAISLIIFFTDYQFPLAFYGLISEYILKNSVPKNLNVILMLIIFVGSISFIPNICIKLFGKTIGRFVFGVDIYDEYNVKQNQKGKYGNFLYWIILRKIKLKTNIQPHKVKLCFNDENNIFRAIKILSLIFFAVSLYSRKF